MISNPQIFQTLPQAFNKLVPDYTSRSWHNFVFQVKHYEGVYGAEIAEINTERAARRILAYLDGAEMNRVADKLETKDQASIRFGNKKDGKGYHGERGDFCLVGGVIKRKHLTLMYRSLEMIGGFSYDLCLINGLGAALGIEWKSLTVFASHANVFALKRNSNEKLYPKLQKIFGESPKDCQESDHRVWEDE